MIHSEYVYNGKKYVIDDAYVSSLSPVVITDSTEGDSAQLMIVNDMRLYVADLFGSHYTIYEIRGNYCLVRKDMIQILERIPPDEITFDYFSIYSVVSPPPYPKGVQIARGSYEIPLRYANFQQVGYVDDAVLTLFSDGTLWAQYTSIFNVGYYCNGLRYFYQNYINPPALSYHTTKNIEANQLWDFSRLQAGPGAIIPTNYSNNYYEFLDYELGAAITSPSWMPEEIKSYNIMNQGVPGTSYFLAMRPVIKRGGWRA